MQAKNFAIRPFKHRWKHMRFITFLCMEMPKPVSLNDSIKLLNRNCIVISQLPILSSMSMSYQNLWINTIAPITGVSKPHQLKSRHPMWKKCGTICMGNIKTQKKNKLSLKEALKSDWIKNLDHLRKSIYQDGRKKCFKFVKWYLVWWRPIKCKNWMTRPYKAHFMCGICKKYM